MDALDEIGGAEGLFAEARGESAGLIPAEAAGLVDEGEAAANGLAAGGGEGGGDGGGAVIELEGRNGLMDEAVLSGFGDSEDAAGEAEFDGTPLAIVYQFACHPIMNPPHKGSSADFPGFASQVIEGALGNDAVALFLQGCGGDINPVRYKEVTRPADAEPLGAMLGASVLAAVQGLETKPGSVLKAGHATISLPRAADYEKRIAAAEAAVGETG